MFTLDSCLEHVLLPVRMDWEEVLVIVQRICRLIGRDYNKDAWKRRLEPLETFRFVPFLDVVERECFNEVSDTMITSVVGELYEEYIIGVLKKVWLFLMCRRRQVGVA